MSDIKTIIPHIFQPKLNNFDEIALQVFQFQYQNNITYHKYCKLLHIHDHESIKSVAQIPFLPIAFFKNHQITSDNFAEEIIFSSSSTSGLGQSHHYVKDVSIYKQSFLHAFQQFYGEPSQYIIFALLPSYLEREGSSLVYMLSELIQLSNHALSGFYLHNLQDLYEKMKQAKTLNKRILLFGATFGLLDFAQHFTLDLNDAIIIETGGMKGRRDELTREEIHTILKNKFFVKHIHSEYGMTELLSQAYAVKDGIFECPAWMRVIITDMNDPFVSLDYAKTGVLNVIDLANIYSCSFIKTDDIGKAHSDGRFEILGRLDNSDLRGCSLLSV